ncbi:Spt20 family-domain-containing protein [Papiliotrema laurentii]|uniref:Spt20 family-domain-containing protein n=1 Tax=Papiliotrema laurentii TaxID=5418 RepID=A0AAD9CXJ7_PAPLA|nr:Spt20 family-domain-containing protein [Papiliotrema laurentii]
MASASGYNHHRFARALLKKSRRWEASLTVELLPNYWRFEHSPVNFQYNGPMTPFLLALRSQVIPPSLIPFLYDIRPPVSFYDGCLVVQINDLRKTPMAQSRVVMRPAPEALAQTIDVMLERNGIVRDEGLALELESRIIAATSPPLYLGTSILPARNAALAITLTTPAHPNVSSSGSYRNPQGNLGVDDKSESEVLRKMMHAGERSSTGMGNFQPKWSILRVKEIMEERARAGAEAAQQGPQNPQQQQGQGQGQPGQPGPPGGPGQGQGPGQPGPPGQGQGGGASTNAGETKPKKSKKKRPAPPADDDAAANAAPAAGAGAPSKPKKKKTEAGGEKKKGAGAGTKKKAAAATAAAKTES